MLLSREVLDRLTPTSECVLETWSITHQCYKIRQIQGGAACLHHGDFKNLEDIDFGVHLQTSEEHWGEDDNKFTFRAKDIRSDNLLIQAYRPIGHFCVKKTTADHLSETFAVATVSLCFHSCLVVFWQILRRFTSWAFQGFHSNQIRMIAVWLPILGRVSRTHPKANQWATCEYLPRGTEITWWPNGICPCLESSKFANAAFCWRSCRLTGKLTTWVIQIRPVTHSYFAVIRNLPNSSLIHSRCR